MNLNRFDRQTEFNPVEIACLLCGLDPVETVSREKIENDLELIKKGLLNAFVFLKNTDSSDDNGLSIDDCLLSSNIEKLKLKSNTPIKSNSKYDKNPFSRFVKSNVDNEDASDEFDYSHGILEEYLNYFTHDGFDDSIFLKTKFSRNEICRWLRTNGHTSIYQFSTKTNVSYLKRIEGILDADSHPKNLTEELQAANIAFTDIARGKEDNPETFKNSLFACINRDFSGLNSKSLQPFADQPVADKSLATVERRTLLTIIGVVCKEAKLDIKKPAKTAGLIQSIADLMDVSIGETTIEGHLKKIPNALEGRMK